MKLLTDIVRWPTKQFRKLYNWTTHWSRTRKAPYALFGLSFAESSFFPIPPDVVLIPMVASHREKWFRNALICTLGSVSGAVLGYLIGLLFYEAAGKPIVDFYGLHDQMNQIGQMFADNAFLTTFTAAFTPIPYKVITIGAGLFRLNIITLLVASLLGRGARFFIVAGLIRIFGKKITEKIEKYFDLFSILFMILLILGFLAINYLF